MTYYEKTNKSAINISETKYKELKDQFEAVFNNAINKGILFKEPNDMIHYLYQKNNKKGYFKLIYCNGAPGYKLRGYVTDPKTDTKTWYQFKVNKLKNKYSFVANEYKTKEKGFLFIKSFYDYKNYYGKDFDNLLESLF